MSLKTQVFPLVLKYSAFAISAHNVQPFRLHWSGDESVELWAEPERFLPAADPRSKDLIKSAGATFEALRLGLSRDGYDLKVDKVLEPSEIDAHRPKLVFVARFKVSKATVSSPEPMAAFLEERFSYRGAFKSFDGALPAKIESERTQIRFITDLKTKSVIGKLYDRVNIKFLNLPGYASELSSWMRLSKRHPKWQVDGLNAESMSLAGFEALGASFIFKPTVFKILSALGLTPILLEEASKIKSAAAVAVICGPKLSVFETGREFFKGWLMLTQMNLFGAPLSLLTDDEEAMEQVKNLAGLSSDLAVYNVFRVGALPKGYVKPQAARRSHEEIKLEDTP